MIADRNRRQRRKPGRRGGGAICPSVASLGEYAGGDRLIAFQRGELNANKDGIIGTPAREEDWALDMTGNWPGFVQKTSGSTDLDQGRTHNPVNEITAITAAIGTNWADPVHDRAGNMITIPKPANLAAGLTAIYDAWNRLVEVKDGATVIARYEYDGLNRRIESHIDSGAPSNSTGIDSYVHYYHNSAWQILETRQSDTPSAQPETLQPKHQYVWSQRYIDAPVLRDENTGANGLCDDDRLYYVNDANFNVTALLDTAGDALERYVYSPYGVVTIYDATWTGTRSESSYANVTLYTGRELDAETGLYYCRNRYYGAQLGRFVSRDPIGYEAGDVSLYRYVQSVPTVYVDPAGLGAGGAIGYPGDPPPPKPNPKPAKICDNFPCGDDDPSVCTRDKCLQTLDMIQKIAQEVPHYWYPNACEKWAFDFAQKLGLSLLNNPCVKENEVQFFYWFHKWAGHAAYKIILIDGSVWYVDNAGAFSIGCPVHHVGTDLPFWIWK